MNYKDISFNILPLAYLLSLISYLSFTSCNSGNKYSKETHMLDSLQAVVQKADSSMKTIDSAKLNKCINHIMIDMQLLKMYNIDTMSTGAAEVFRNYSAIRWALSTVSGRRGLLLNELEKSQAQLGHLNHDLQHGLINRDSVQIYMGFETKKAGELIEVSTKSANDVKTQLPLFDLITPQADSLVGMVKEHKKI